jgi:DNA-binding CsgD family transcriptional regulator
VARLSERDFRGILAVLAEAEAVEGAEPFPVPVLEALRRLIPCDCVSYHNHEPGSPRRNGVWAAGDFVEVSKAVSEAMVLYHDQDPVLSSAHRLTRAVKHSDFLTRRNWHLLGIYNYVARPLGIEHMLSVWLPCRRGFERGFMLDRSSREFSERDRLVLDLLRPHLIQLARRASRFPLLAVPGSFGNSPTLTPREHELLNWLSLGKTDAELAQILVIAPGTVRKHLDNIYAKLGVRTRTAAVAAVRVHLN